MTEIRRFDPKLIVHPVYDPAIKALFKKWRLVRTARILVVVDPSIAVAPVPNGFGISRVIELIRNSPNPAVAREVLPVLGGIGNVRITEPLPYEAFVRELCASRFVISDSGGVQEEAPWLGRPVLVVREKTERPQAVEAGASFLCGTADVERIVQAALPLTEDTPAFHAASARRSLFGDGYTAQRIVQLLGTLPHAAP